MGLTTVNTKKLLVGWKQKPDHMTWSQCRDRLTKGTKDVDTVIALLHSGFDAREADPLQHYDRVIFYLELADAWMPPDVNRSWVENRIRRKALDVLITYCFKEIGRSIEIRNALKDLSLFRKYLWFFRTEMSGFALTENSVIRLPFFRNMPTSAEDKTARYMLEFVKEFCAAAWKSRDSAIIPEIERCSVLEILHCADPKHGLWNLLPVEFEKVKQWNLFTPTALDFLEKMARRHARSDHEDLEIGDLALFGSVPARIRVLARAALHELSEWDAGDLPE